MASAEKTIIALNRLSRVTTTALPIFTQTAHASTGGCPCTFNVMAWPWPVKLSAHVDEVPPRPQWGRGVWGLFGIWDSVKNINSVELTKFRFMVAIPTLLMFFALTFTPIFRRWTNVCLTGFVVAAGLLAIKQLLDYGVGNPYYLSSGSSALNFALILVFCIGLFQTGAF